MKSIFSFITLLIIAGTLNSAKVAPISCQPIVIKDQSIKLATKKPALLVLIHNRSNSDLWVTGFEDSSHLEAGHWSALIIGKKPLELNCVESRPGHEQQTPCVSLVEACKWPAVKVKGQSEGWVIENLPLAFLKSELGQKGFKIPLTPS